MWLPRSELRASNCWAATNIADDIYLPPLSSPLLGYKCDIRGHQYNDFWVSEGPRVWSQYFGEPIYATHRGLLLNAPPW